MENKTVEDLILDYAVAVDTGNAACAEKFLDAAFRVVLHNYQNKGTTTIIAREQYLEMIQDGKVGGTKRNISLLLTHVHENAAIVIVRLEGAKSVFTNYYSLIKSNNEWLIVQDLPQIVNKPIN